MLEKSTTMRRTPRSCFAVVIALGSLAACGAPDELPFDAEPVATATEAFTATANQKASGDSSRGATAVSLVTTMLGKGTAVAGYASKPAGAPTAAWSFSPDAGVSWSAHRSDEAGEFQWPAAPVNDGPFAYYGDAPTLVALEAFPGVVVAVVSAYGEHASAVDAIALVSTDGGAHFKNPTLITTESYADRPGAAPVLEYVTAGPVVGTSGGAGEGVWTAYRDHQAWFMRKLAYDPASQRMKIAGEDTRIPISMIKHSGDALTEPAGPSSILAIINTNGEEVVQVAWSSYDNRLDTCPSAAPRSTPWRVEWNVAAAQWSSTVGLVGGWLKGKSLFDDNYWPRCLGAGGRFFKNTIQPRLAADPVSHTVWAATNSSDGKSGTSISIYRLAEHPFDATTLGDWILRSTKQENGDPLLGVHDQWGPTLAVLRSVGDALPTIAVTWHDTRDDPASPGLTTTLWGGFSHSEAVADMFAPIVFSVGRVTPLSANAQPVPWALSDFWGRYDGIAASPATGDFLVAWSDSRAGGKTEIWTSRITP